MVPTRHALEPVGAAWGVAVTAGPILRVVGLSRQFQALRAVDDVSFSVEAGELVGLIGPNGAGKTTLFNCLAGALALTTGQVWFEGTQIGGVDPARIARLGLARTYQNLRVFPDVTAFDNVSVGAIGRIGVSMFGALFPVLGRRREQAVADATLGALRRFDLLGHADEPAGNLAYGQKKMLEIARALALRPKMLLLDEPAAGLNPNETVELAQRIRSLRDEGLTVLLVEHDMPMVMQICDRIVVLESGRKIADASPAEVRANPEVRVAYLGKEGR